MTRSPPFTKTSTEDLTSFINLALLGKVIKIKALVTKKYWFEIDNQKDKIFTESKI